MFILFFFYGKFCCLKRIHQRWEWYLYFCFVNVLHGILLLKFLLVVKFETIHRPTKLATNHPQTSQTTHKPVKYQTNHPLITQKLPRFFLKIFFMNRNIFLTHPAREEKWVHFFKSLLDFAFRLLNCTILYHP